jgi:hypothetical protein
MGDFRSEAERLFAADAQAESPEEAAFSAMALHSPLQIELLFQKSFCLFVDQKMVNLRQIPFEHCIARIGDLKTWLF